jgi:ribosomal protein S18 acetylase RimI-like enzyme
MIYQSPYLKLLAVAESHHRSGVGRALMRRLEAQFPSDRQLLLLVTDTNRKARTFYERLEYHYIGTLPDYVKDGVHECLYSKRLGRSEPTSARRPLP